MNYIACPTLGSGQPFLSTVLRHLDCQAQTLGSFGYQALANQGSAISTALTALLTIFVALFGIRLLLGHIPDLQDGVVAVVKIGAVLLLATSWPAYRTLIYDLAVVGPGELMAAIGQPSGIPGADGSQINRLQAADEAITTLVGLGTGRNDLLSIRSSSDGGQQAGAKEPILDDFALSAGRALFAGGVIGGFGVVYLGIGVLLALAPFFAGFLLFAATRGIFIGWLRSLLALMLAGVVVRLTFGVQLALLEPWLADVLSQRLSRIITPQAPTELLVLALAFDIVVAGAFLVIGRLAFTLDLPVAWRRYTRAEAAPLTQRDLVAARSNMSVVERGSGSDFVSSQRAHAVADALSTAGRREASGSVTTTRAGSGVLTMGSGTLARNAVHSSSGTTAAGTSQRRTARRRSQSAARRDSGR